MYALISGAEPLPATLREAFKQRFGAPILEGYGLSETSPAISLNTPHVRKAGSVGKPLPVSHVKITDDDGKALPTGRSARSGSRARWS
jgi:long-subunit acyl-CoA synthetase (AMP-forming)